MANLSSFPGGIDTPTDTFTGATSMAGVHAQHHDLLADAVLNIETSLVSGTVVNVKDWGAKGDGVTDDSAAIMLAHSKTLIVSAGISMRGVLYFPPGFYVIGSTLTPIVFAGDTFRWVGSGCEQTFLILKDGVNVPIIDTSNRANHMSIEHMGFGCKDATGRATHTTNAFPILKLTASYLSVLRRCVVQFAPGDGIQIGDGITSPPADGITFTDCMIFNCNGRGIFSDRSEAMKVVNCVIETCGMYDIHIKGNPNTTYHQSLISGTRFEDQAGTGGVLLEAATGVNISGNYFNAPTAVTVDEASHGNYIVGNQFLSGATLHDGGFLNTCAPNDGLFDPCVRPRHFYFPGSRISDGDGTMTSTAFWTGQNRSGGTGSLSKQSPIGSRTGIGFDEVAGRGAPLKVIPNSVNGYSAFQDMAVGPGETYLVEAYWSSDVRNPSGATFQVQLTNTAGSTTYWDTGALTFPQGPTTNQWRLARTSFVFQVPAAVTTIRTLLSATFSSIVHLDRVNFIKLSNNNGGMDGTFAAGVAPGWAVNVSNGAPTTAAETTIIRPNLPGAAIPTGTALPSSQKLAVANGTDFVELLSTPVIDSSRLYCVRGYVNTTVGNPKQAYLAWGDSVTGSFYYKWKATPTRNNVWDPIARVFRPGTGNLLLAGLTPGAAATAYFDDIAIIPLRELITEKTAVSQEFTLSAAAASQAVIVPSIDSVLRRVTVCYTVASDASAGVAINVGTYASAAYYGTVTSAINQTQGTQTEVALSKTDIVAGRPIVVACAGGKVGAGKVQIALEYE